PSTYTLSLHDALPILSSLFTRVLAGTRPIDSNRRWPSGESTKSAKSTAAFGCGALRATPMPCGRAATGCTGTKSIGAPLRLSERSEEHTSELQSRGHL